MSDDLISRKAVLDVLNDVDQDGLLKISQIIDFIEDQPTAFDKEKVIEEIRKRVGTCESEHCKEYYDCDTCRAEEAVKVVEKGGIE